MTAQAATRMWSRHDANIRSLTNKRLKARIREAYQVVCDATDSLVDVLNAPDLPANNSAYQGSSVVRVVDRNPVQVSPIFWIIEILYEGETGSQGINTLPSEAKPIVRWSKTETDNEVDQDVDGNPIITVNFERIKGVTMKRSDFVCSITRNYDSIDMATTHQYLHSVNSDKFQGFPAGTGRLVAFDAEEINDPEDGGYYRVTAGIHFRVPYNTTPEKAWYKRVIHEGFTVLQPVTTFFRHAVDDLGQETSQPVLLDADGFQLAADADPHWLEFKMYTPLPYATLGLV